MSFLVEATGFEHATSWSRTKRATKLRYTPIILIIYLFISINIIWLSHRHLFLTCSTR